MKVSCPECEYSGTISDHLIPDAGHEIACPKCKTKFFIQKQYREPLAEKKEKPAAPPVPIRPAEPLYTAADTHIRLIAANCPNCGGSLKVPENKKVAYCEHCGSSIIIQEIHDAKHRGDEDVDTLMKIARDAMKGHNYQEAYNYFNKILEIDYNNYQAWTGKGHAAGMLSTYENPRMEEMIQCIKNGVDRAPNDIKGEIKENASLAIFDGVITQYDQVLKHDSLAAPGTGFSVTGSTRSIGANVFITLSTLNIASKNLASQTLEATKPEKSGSHTITGTMCEALVLAQAYSPFNIWIVNYIGEFIKKIDPYQTGVSAAFIQMMLDNALSAHKSSPRDIRIIGCIIKICSFSPGNAEYARTAKRFSIILGNLNPTHEMQHEPKIVDYAGKKKSEYIVMIGAGILFIVTTVLRIISDKGTNTELEVLQLLSTVLFATGMVKYLYYSQKSKG